MFPQKNTAGKCWCLVSLITLVSKIVRNLEVSRLEVFFVLTQGFRGTNCEDQLSVCAGGLICYNGGTCQESSGLQVCLCPANFNGEGCIYAIPGQPAGPGTNDVIIPATLGTWLRITS